EGHCRRRFSRAPPGTAAVGRLGRAAGIVPASAPRVRTRATGGASDPRTGARAHPPDSPGPNPRGRTGPSLAEPQGDWGERSLAVGGGTLLLAPVRQPPRAGEPGRVDPHAVRQR